MIETRTIYTIMGRSKYVWPGHTFTGPGDRTDLVGKKPLGGKTDVAAMTHDKRFGRISKAGGNPYIPGGALKANRQFVSKSGWDIPGILGKAYFTATDSIAPNIIGMNDGPVCHLSTWVLLIVAMVAL